VVMWILCPSRPPLSTSRDGHIGTTNGGQKQAGPQVQVSPQRHPAHRGVCVALHPQVQVAPAQDGHEQAFEVVVLLDMVTSSF
jgi:hypothetical protein